MFDPPADGTFVDATAGTEVTVDEEDVRSDTHTLCNKIYMTRSAICGWEDPCFASTSKNITYCVLHSDLGELVETFGALQEGRNYYAVPKGHHFVWPATKIGQKITLPYPLNGDNEKIILETLTTTPRLFRLHNFITSDEVEKMIENANTLGYERSTGGLATNDAAGKENQGVFTSRRTSENSWDLRSEIGRTLKTRAYAALRLVHDTATEDGFQVVRYKPGQFYMSHTDYFEVDEDPYWNFNSYSGGSNRFATVFLYLSDAELGGETVFPNSNGIPQELSEEQEAEYTKAAQELFPSNKMARDFVDECKTNFRVTPKKGDAVVFYHQDRNGQLDPAALHGACPVLKGMKHGANLWIWNGPVYDLDIVEQNKPEDQKNPKLKQHPVMFTNNLEQEVTLYWKGPDALVRQGEIPAGDLLELNSYHGHVFSVKAKSDIDGPEIQKLTIHYQHLHMVIDGVTKEPIRDLAPPTHEEL